MSIQIGDIDIAKEIIDLHYQLRRTQVLLEIALGKISKDGQAAFSPQDVADAEEKAIRFLQDRFPNMGITKN